MKGCAITFNRQGVLIFKCDCKSDKRYGALCSDCAERVLDRLEKSLVKGDA